MRNANEGPTPCGAVPVLRVVAPDRCHLEQRRASFPTGDDTFASLVRIAPRIRLKLGTRHGHHRLIHHFIEEVGQADPVLRFGQVALQAPYRSLSRQRVRPRELIEGLDLLLQLIEERVGIIDRNLQRPTVLDEGVGVIAERTMDRPVDRESSALGSRYRAAQRFVPLGRPAAYEEAEFVEDAVEELVDLGWVFGKFLLRVPNTRVTIISVNLQYAASGLNNLSKW